MTLWGTVSRTNSISAKLGLEEEKSLEKYLVITSPISDWFFVQLPFSLYNSLIVLFLRLLVAFEWKIAYFYLPFSTIMLWNVLSNVFPGQPRDFSNVVQHFGYEYGWCCNCFPLFKWSISYCIFLISCWSAEKFSLLQFVSFDFCNWGLYFQSFHCWTRSVVFVFCTHYVDPIFFKMKTLLLTDSLSRKCKKRVNF